MQEAEAFGRLVATDCRLRAFLGRQRQGCWPHLPLAQEDVLLLQCHTIDSARSNHICAGALTPTQVDLSLGH